MSKELLAQIKANQKLLDECPKHKFETLHVPIFQQKLKCLNCGGHLDTLYAFYYAKGFKAGGGNPNEIIENFE